MNRKSPVEAKPPDSRQQAIAHLAELIGDVPIAMLTSMRADHTLHSRPMVNINSACKGELWFFTHELDPKNEEIRGNPQVNVTVAEPLENKFVSVAGSGAIVRDPKRNEMLWNRECEAWFPQGPTSEDLVLIRVEMQRAEYWDAQRNTMIAVGGSAGEPGEAIDHQRIEWEDTPGA